MGRDPDDLREKADRVRWWAVSVRDPRDRQRLEVVAREYEQMAREAQQDSRSMKVEAAD